MKCPSCNKEVRIGSIYCHYCGEPLENIFRQETDSRTSAQDNPIVNEQVTQSVLVCDYCSRQDDTLRIVNYPFVVSLIVVTYRSAFGGLMCKKHQNLFLVLASAITATIGWIGIPYGIIYAPLTLLKLARGGDQPKNDNIQMLKTLAKYKYSQGDIAGTVKCLQASLQFGENAEIRQEIQSYLQKRITTEKEIRLRTKISSILALLLGAALLGVVIGVLDYIFTEFISVELQGDMPIYLALFSWIPFVSMAFLGGIVLYQFLEWAITKTHLRNYSIALVIGGLSAIVAAYSIAQGEALGDYLFYLFVGRNYEAGIGVILVCGGVALIGGFLWLFAQFEHASTASIILLILLGVILAYYLGMVIRSAIKNVQWQKRIARTDTNPFGDHNPT